MASKYASVSISGYNASPPPDDATQSEANKLKWSTVKTKIGDPLKTAVEAINTALAGSFGTVVPRTSDTALAASNYDDTIVCTGTWTQTFVSAATLGAGWYCYITNSGTGVITLDPSSSETINGVATIKLYAGMGGKVVSDGTNLVMVTGKPTAAHKVVTVTRDNTASNGTQAITGVGFKPRSIVFFAQVDGTTGFSAGMTDGSTNGSVRDNHSTTADTWTNSSSYCIDVLTGSGTGNSAAISSFDADGFTLSWTKTGSPTGNTVAYAICFM